MHMIDVLKKLAEIDANGGLKEATQMINDPTVAVINESTVQECGPMGMPGMATPGSNTPASFSVNASAATGDEVANMLTQILTLAGVKKDGPVDGPMGHDEPGHPLTGEPPMKGADDMKAAIQAIDQAEQETSAMGGDMDGPEMEDESEPDAMGGEPAPVSDMAQDVQDMADELAGKDKEDLGLESFDNEPQVQTRKTDPLNDFAQIINKVREFDYVPAQSASNPMKAESTETTEAPIKEATGLVDLTNQLFKEYESFKAQ